MIILFRPFDLGKWCVMGFCAFLAGFLQGGNGFNSSFNTNNFNNNSFNNKSAAQIPELDLHQFDSTLKNVFTGMQVGMVVLIALAVLVVIFAVILVIYWLGARGQFMFLDNIVRNRGAIAWPWNYYARQANSLFGFYLLFILISFAIFLPILGVAAVMCYPLITEHRWPDGGEIIVFVILGLLYLGLAIVLGVIVFIFREFGVPIMFRQGLPARPAFWKSMGLLRQHPGSVVVFVLLRIAIFIGVAILSIIVCCATCCIGAIPYVGTVMLLPVLVYVRCFTLDCLAQFGPEYDAWTVDVPSPGSPGQQLFSPPPPPG